MKESIIFDSQIETKELQMLKIAIPYLNSSFQKSMALFVKYIELQKTMRLFQNGDLQSLSIEPEADPKERLLHMLTDMKAVLNEKEKESIDSLLNMFQVLSSYDFLSRQEV